MIAALLEQLAALPGSRFANLTYTNKVGGKVLTPETSRFHLILGADTENMYRSEIAKLESFLSSGAPLAADMVYRHAAMELLDSRRTSLAVGIGNNPAYTCSDAYISYPGMRGVRIHKETGEVYLSGHEVSKTVLTAGTYKTVHSGPKTIAKAHISKVLGFAKFRLFVLSNITRAALNGNVLEIETV